MPNQKYPFESEGFLSDGPKLWRRLTGRGMVVREGTLTVMRRFKLADGNGIGLTGVDPTVMTTIGNAYFELKFKEEPDVIQGYIHTSLTIGRIKRGERVGIKVDPETLWVKKIWPLDRKLKWYVF